MILEDEIMAFLDRPGLVGKKYKFSVLKNKFCSKEGYSPSELRDVLAKLEVEGKVLITERDEISSFAPSSKFFTGVIKINKYNEGTITHDGKVYKVKVDNLNGALNGDTVLCRIVDKVKDDANVCKVKKIVKRLDGMVLCEVTVNDKKQMVLQPVIAELDGDIQIANSYMKPLVEGDRIRVHIDRPTNGTYYGEYINYVGHRNDPDAELKVIAAQNGIKIEFSPEAIKEADSIPTTVSKEEMDGREDLRDELIYSIDGAKTKDRDDAISIRRDNNGNYIVGIHIADVSHYIRPGSKLWEEAMDRGTSVYMADTVIPMIPHKLSNGICSLNPEVDRLTFSCFITLDPNGKIIDYQFKEAVINSKKAMTYDEVNQILIDKEIPEGYTTEMVDNLYLAHELSKKLEKIKERRGYVNFGTNDLEVEMNENGEPIGFKPKEARKAEKLIENFMLIAGECAACYLMIPCPYRVHEEPDEEKVEEAFVTLKKSGIKVRDQAEIVDGHSIQKILSAIKSQEDRDVAANIILRSMKRARYDVENYGHFGLGLEKYGQFTSPIRRAPDLWIHNAIKMQLNNTYDLELENKYYKETEKFCNHATQKELRADQAEREADEYEMARYIGQHTGEKFISHVTYLTSKAIFIKTEEGITGYLRPQDLEGDTFLYDDKSLSYKGKNSHFKIRIGTPLVVTAIDATLEFGMATEDLLTLKKEK